MDQHFTTFEILGNSAGIPTSGRNVSSVIVSLTGYDIMLDCGEGTYLTWRRAGYRWKRLNYICITHLHPDHIGGLVPLLFYRKLLHIESPLEIVGPAPLEDFIRSSLQFSGIHLDYPLKFHVAESVSSLELSGGVRVRWAALDHKVPCFGYRFESPGGRVLTFITDTLPCGNGSRLAQGADVLIHEATFEPAQAELAKKAFHTTTLQALDLAENAGVKQLYLTHFSPRVQDEALEKLRYRGMGILPAGRQTISETD
ncbi:MAG: MBL fold metallo-hydrolase [FCB group bacterium]|nr:MBL fold metallo-hydrolase [FCB group bacterium]